MGAMAIDPTAIKTKSLYAVGDAATILGVTEQTVRSYLKDGTLKGVKTKKRRLLVPGDELVRFLKGG